MSTATIKLYSMTKVASELKADGVTISRQALPLLYRFLDIPTYESGGLAKPIDGDGLTRVRQYLKDNNDARVAS